MAQRCMFFDPVSGDRSYDASSFAALLRALIQRDGVIYGYGGGMQVAATEPASMDVTVATGGTFVQGRLLEVHTAAERLGIGAANPTYPRIDRIVARLDNSPSVRTLALAVKAGTPAASPTPPTLQRDGTAWELSLAQVRVNAGVTSITSANITDERSDATLCGNAFGFLEPTTGHKHTGAAGDGPKLTHDAIDTAKISAFRAYQSTAQSLAAATWTKLAFQTEEYDQKGEYDPATYRFTAAATGLYLFTVGAQWPPLADGGNYALGLYKNGALAVFLESTHIGYANGTPASVRSVQIKLNAGDYVEAYIYSQTAGNTGIGVDRTFFAGMRVA